MHLLFDITAPDRIVVGVFQLLSHHFFILELLRMAPLLPKLICLICLVLKLEIAQLLEQR